MVEVKSRPILFSGPMVQSILNTKPDVWPPEPIDASKPFKSQTRRIVKPQPVDYDYGAFGIKPSFVGPQVSPGLLAISVQAFNASPTAWGVKRPYALPGDHLWVRESFETRAYGAVGEIELRLADGRTEYKITCDEDSKYRTTQWVKRPSIFMPRWASGIDLIVKSIRVERLQDITEEDALTEGLRRFTKDGSLWKYWPYDPCDGPLKCSWQDLPRSAREAYLATWDWINGKGSAAKNPFVWVVELMRISKAVEAVQQ